MREKPPCEQCKLTKKAYKKEPDCSACLPEVLPGNEDVLKVYKAVQSQVITAGMSGAVIGLKHQAVWTYIEKYKIKDQLTVFEKVTDLFHHFLSQDAVMRKLESMK